MAIDRSGEWWTGSEAADLDHYLRGLTADGYPATRFVHARCACGSDCFALDVDSDEGCARRTCTRCQTSRYICDSDQIWEEADPEAVDCPCGASAFQIAVAFSLRDDGSVKWITVGVRCTSCGVLVAPVEWKIDYAPTDHLFEQV